MTQRVLTLALGLLLPFLILPATAGASIAYGSINNFDTVNDTGQPCHGFEIEIDDVHSTDITYTYDWNHYGPPKITEDHSNPAHPKVFVRYESAKNPDGSWTAFTAVPAAPISPTDGHQFTDPSVNFGGEHFGVGFYGNPTAVIYNWLVDDGAGNLVHGGIVNISTPTFNYAPPVAAQPAKVVAKIVLPPPPVPAPGAPPLKEFGDPMWVKVTKTTSHNNGKVELRDLVSDDPNDPNDRNWKNGEAAEIEMEWKLMQTEFSKVNGGANGELEGAPDDLPGGDEVVTRRYDFYKYAGPLDQETNEVKTDVVGADDIHGTGIYSDVVVVGDYIGAQMAGFDAKGQIGLIDHLQDGEAGVPYVNRTVVVGGTAPIETTVTGALPDGMAFDTVNGILYGTPSTGGLYSFTVQSADGAGGNVSKSYDLNIANTGGGGGQNTLVLVASPPEGGFVFGDGTYDPGTLVTASAAANPGWSFVNWTLSGIEISALPDIQFTLDASYELVANFVVGTAQRTLTLTTAPIEGGAVYGDGAYDSGTLVTASAVANPGWSFVNWTWNGTEIAAWPDIDIFMDADYDLVANFVVSTFTLTYDADPEGTITGLSPQMVNYGASGTEATAVPNRGYHFLIWSDGSTQNPRTDAVVAADISVTAIFAPNTCTLTYDADANGTITGVSPQVVDYGGSGTEVTAVPNKGYLFGSWSDGLTDNPRADIGVAANVNVTASFVPLPTAAFTGASTSGTLPLTVTFTDQSSGNGYAIATWLWNFGDGASSTAQNPVHIYEAAGKYAVSLTVTTVIGGNTVIKGDFVTVNALPPAAITVTSPNGGELWAPNSTHTITWTATSVTGDVAVLLHNMSLGTYTTLARVPALPGSWSWTVPAGQAVGGMYKIRVASLSSSGVYDYSNSYFAIGSGTPAITVTSANGREIWAPNSTHAVTWSANALSGKVAILLHDMSVGTYTTLATVPVQPGSWSWTIPAGQTIGGMYKIRVASLTNSAVYDYSDDYFVIGSGAPSITVASPNGGEALTRGTATTITWNSNCVMGTMKVYLYNYATGVAEAVTTGFKPASSGVNTYSWTIPAGHATGNKFKIRVIDTRGTLSDFSNGFFTIN